MINNIVAVKVRLFRNVKSLSGLEVMEDVGPGRRWGFKVSVLEEDEDGS